MKTIIGIAMLAGVAAAQTGPDRGAQEEARACTACHSLAIIHSQRLSKAAWNRELDKMAGWGTKIADRDALLEYLVSNYGDDKAPPPPAMTKDASDHAQR
jgi:cytochrome c5